MTEDRIKAIQFNNNKRIYSTIISVYCRNKDEKVCKNDKFCGSGRVRNIQH